MSGKLDVAKFLLLMFVRQRVVDMRLIDVVLERVRQAEKQLEHGDDETVAAGSSDMIKSYLLGGSQSRTPSTEGGGQATATPGRGVVAAASNNNEAVCDNGFGVIGGGGGGLYHQHDEYKLGYD